MGVMDPNPLTQEKTKHTVFAAAKADIETAEASAVNARKAREQLYKSREPIYPKTVSGTWRTIKWSALVVMLAIYYLAPWIRWDRGPNRPDQALLVDVANGRIFLFDLEFWPQEIYYITALLILGSLALFLATTLFGRIWCGFACPQTVWTDLFIFVERLWEGERSARIRLEKSPWTANKIVRRTGKHATWLLIAFATGGAWILYFHDAPTLAATFFTGTAPVSAYVFAGVLTFTTYALAGLMREQVCTYMCPWPRIQGALTDAETIEVVYRHDRGEPRAPAKKGTDFTGRGQCIACNQCVAACPMGIDIRDGAQLECISCGLCIDACDEVMRRVGLPTGLIGWDTDINIARRKAGQASGFRLIRPRTILYAILIALIGAIMLAGLGTRATMELNSIRDRNPNFVRLSDGSIRNGYTLKIVNRAAETRDFVITMEAPEGLSISQTGEPGDTTAVSAPGDAVRPVRVFVTLRPGAALPDASTSVIFTITETSSGEAATSNSVFISR
jgi:cytochrome c oxidase accessory protein FixG